MKKAYEVEVHFIGEPEFYYFDSKEEAETAARELNSLPPEEAFFGKVKTEARINEIMLNDNQYIQGNEIVTEYRQKTYSTINNNGDCGTTGVSYARAVADAEYNNEKYPDEEWEVIED